MLLTFGLFETAADVCAALNDLSKAGFKPSSFALVARDIESDTGEQSDRRTTVAQALDALELEPVAIYFDTLTLIVIPEEGTYLAGGWPARELTRLRAEGHPEQTQLGRFLIGLGCGSEEAAFLCGRLQAGTLMVGIEDSDEERLRAAREIFTEQQAIHVGDVALPDTGAARLPADIPLPDAPAVEDAVVLDVATLLVMGGNGATVHNEMIGRQLVDENGAEIGPITRIAIDPLGEGDRTPAYVIVQHGGFLGVGSNEYVIPANLISAAPAAGGYQAQLALEVLENAPAFDARLPLSRREELLICGYYGTVPYWEQRSPEQAGVNAAG